MIRHQEAAKWVEEMGCPVQARPGRVGQGLRRGEAETHRQALSTGELYLLNQGKLPGCVLHRTAQNDVARTEHLDLHLHPKTGRCRTNQQLDGPEGGLCEW